MSRNQNSHFAMIPQANIQRSKFDISNSVTTTMNAGLLYPLEFWEILPGDTFDVSTSILARMQTLITPLMSDIYMDVYYFYCPNRLLWSNWQRFMGERDQPWFDEQPEYTVPQIRVNMSSDTGSATMRVRKGTVADYLGLPLPVPSGGEAGVVSVNHLPFRMYCRVWNEWFRSEALQDMVAFNDNDTSVDMNNMTEPFYGGNLAPANKFRDMFTSALPMPQLGAEVTIGVGSTAPVFTMPADHSWDTLAQGKDNPTGLHWKKTIEDSDFANSWFNLGISKSSSDATVGITGASNGTNTIPTHSNLVPSNLFADISNATGISINELRIAFATQRYYETLARSGSRYIELLDSIFGVQAPDQRLQRSEYLGGQRVHINVNQTIQQSETNTTPLGNVGAYSLTVDNQDAFHKSFVEHGYVMAFATIRYDHAYQDGISKEWLRKDDLDFYNPIYKNIGEQPIRNIEIFATGTNTDNEVFGYQEAWYEYRFKNNRVSGEMRSRYAQTLDYWHLADNYTSLPTLSSEWLMETGATVDRAIAVSQRVADQFMADIYFNVKATRPMPIYSIPGLSVL